jgi:hypothetical protein
MSNSAGTHIYLKPHRYLRVEMNLLTSQTAMRDMITSKRIITLEFNKLRRKGIREGLRFTKQIVVKGGIHEEGIRQLKALLLNDQYFKTLLASNQFKPELLTKRCQ